MKKHNESKSIKGIRHSKGRVLCKVIAFTMIFVMLFCISAYAAEEEFTQTITVKDQYGQIQSIQVNVLYREFNINGDIEISKEIPIEDQIEVLDYSSGISIQSQGIFIAVYSIELDFYTNEQGNEVPKVLEQFGIQNLTDEELAELDLQEVKLFENNAGEITLTNIENIEQLKQYIAIYESLEEDIKTKTNYEENIIIFRVAPEPPVYEGFIGNARGLFDMLFESIQSIFNWLVSPNVIVFFGLGIILTLTTIGILIARRFLWGR